MADPRDEVDDWLSGEVTPLYPPAGSLERIRRRARQRRARQAALAVACCAAVLAAAATVPELISASAGHRAHGHPAIALAPTPPAAPQPGPHDSGLRTPDSHGKPEQVRQHTTLSHSWTGPPGNFRPTSVTFVGTGSGTVLGAVIGQAGTPGRCATRDCTSLAGTANYGASWYGVSAPEASGPDGSAGVSQLRFANLADGWAYGPALYTTRAGGWPWIAEPTGGQRVIDIEAAPPASAPGRTSAFGVFGTCTGSGPDYAAHCTSYSLWTSVAGSKSWRPAAVPAAYARMTSTSSAAPLLVIAGSTAASAVGYLLTPSGVVLSGPADSGSRWAKAGQAPCAPGPADPAARTAATPGAQLASGPELLLACDGAPGGSTATVLYRSFNGRTWQSDGPVPATGAPLSLASAVAGQAVLATTTGIWYLAGAGKTWQATSIAGGTPAGGFSYVGMTTGLNGVAIPANADLGEIYVTSDGGQTWTPSRISG